MFHFENCDTPGMYLRAGSQRIPPATLNKFSGTFCPDTKIFYPEYEILNNIDLVSGYQHGMNDFFYKV